MQLRPNQRVGGERALIFVFQQRSLIHLHTESSSTCKCHPYRRRLGRKGHTTSVCPCTRRVGSKGQGRGGGHTGSSSSFTEGLSISSKGPQFFWGLQGENPDDCWEMMWSFCGQPHFLSPESWPYIPLYSLFFVHPSSISMQCENEDW